MIWTFTFGTAAFLSAGAFVFLLIRYNTLLSSKSEKFHSFESEKEMLLRNFEETKKLLLAQNDENLQHQKALFLTEKENLQKQFDLEKKTLLSQMEQIRLRWEERLTLQKTLSANEISALRNAFDTEKKTLLQTIEEIKMQFSRTFAEMEKDRENRAALMKEEFKTLSNSILEEKSGKLHEANKKQLEAVITPLSEKMTEFKTAVEESRTKGVELNAALKTQIEKMMAETCRIGVEAKELVNALRGEQKTQGDWGEMILEELLQRSGLRPGVHYETQTVIRDASGKVLQNEENNHTMRPDVIIHYPDEKDVIIDSKVSLTAYMDYMNAENEENRARACQRHVESVKNHVKELVEKNYAAYLAKSGRETIDFVVMFVPNEGPYHLAMISEPSLWAEAFRKKVLIVSPVNLMALLKIIHIAWTRDEQNRNQQAILDTATELLERLYKFYEAFDAVGDAISSAGKKYEEAVSRLKKEGRNRSVVGSGEKLRALGVRMTKNSRSVQRFQLDGEIELPENSRKDTAAEPQTEMEGKV